MPAPVASSQGPSCRGTSACRSTTSAWSAKPTRRMSASRSSRALRVSGLRHVGGTPLPPPCHPRTYAPARTHAPLLDTRRPQATARGAPSKRPPGAALRSACRTARATCGFRSGTTTAASAWCGHTRPPFSSLLLSQRVALSRSSSLLRGLVPSYCCAPLSVRSSAHSFCALLACARFGKATVEGCVSVCKTARGGFAWTCDYNPCEASDGTSRRLTAARC